VLEFDELLGSVYYIPSASHLNQVVFTLEREQSRLARNFAAIASALTMTNPADPEGAKNYLDRLLRRDPDLLRSLISARLDEELESIGQKHRQDVEVMFRLARVRLRQGLVDEALALLDALLETDPNVSEARLLRATLRTQRDDAPAAEQDLRGVLMRSDLDVIQIRRAVRALIDIAPASLREIPRFQAYAGLDPDGRISLLLDVVQNHVGAMDQLFDELEELARSDMLTPRGRELVRSTLVLHRIHRRDFAGAMELIGERPTKDSNTPNLFNYAIAEWGLRGKAPVDLFNRVIAARRGSEWTNENHPQCFGLAYAVIGDKEEARKLLETARQMALRSRRAAFSAWTYETVTAAEFADHIAQMVRALDEGQIAPTMIAREK
jgi:tetratricopeptide (TPR) repeat protein